MRTLILLSLSLILYGCVSSSTPEKLKPLYIKQDTPLEQYTGDITSCRKRVKSGEFQTTYNNNQAAIGGDPLLQSFAKGFEEGRLRARLTFFCLETEGYERVLVPAGTFKRLESLPESEQIQQINKLLAEQPRDQSMKELLFGNS